MYEDTTNDSSSGESISVSDSDVSIEEIEPMEDTKSKEKLDIRTNSEKERVKQVNEGDADTVIFK